jgi:hypothetical protein
MFGFKSKRAEVIRHWYALVPGFNTSTEDFYASVEGELKERQVPGLQMSRVDFAEGGVLSDKRTYLRMIRERLVFDICAAPFGKAFFFSCRFAEIPAVVSLSHLLVLAIAVPICVWVSFALCVRIFGVMAPVIWPFAAIALFFAAIYFMRNAVAMGFNDLDATLIQIPVIGAVYETWIRKETYYRQDTRFMYCDTVDEVVKARVEEVTGAKGIKLLRFNDYNPILGELYKPSTVQLPKASAPA